MQKNPIIHKSKWEFFIKKGQCKIFYQSQADHSTVYTLKGRWVSLQAQTGHLMAYSLKKCKFYSDFTDTFQTMK